MTTEQMLACVRSIPFRPFTIHLADGREIAVRHPEAIAYTGGRIAVVLHPNDQLEIIDLLLVSSLLMSPLEPAS
jgi:hypothetical protein